MKKQYILIFLLSLSVAMFAQTLPNGNFENWDGDHPTDWESVNEVTNTPATGNLILVSESTDAQNGSKSVMMETGNVMGNATPGYICLGDYSFNFATFSPDSTKAGIAYAYRPTSIKGYFKFAPAGSDIFCVSLSLTKWNGTSRDVIGTAYYTHNTAETAWTEFNVNINYNSTDVPDTLRLNATCVYTGATTGTQVWVDNFTLEGVNAVNDIESNESISIFPNPVNKNLNLSIANAKSINNLNVKLYNISGQVVLNNSYKNPENEISLSVENLSAGTYIVEVSNDENIISKEKIIIE